MARFVPYVEPLSGHLAKSGPADPPSVTHGDQKFRYSLRHNWR
jgi:hypothetical protein